MIPLIPGYVRALSPFRVECAGDPAGGLPCQRVAPGVVGQRGAVIVAGGQRVWLGAYDKDDLDLAALTSRVAALESPGPWVACALGSGFTGSASVRKLSPTSAEFRASLTGSFVDGNTGNLCTLPAGFVPVGGDARIGAYLAGAHPGICYLGTSGIVGVNQRSGSTRTTLDARGTYGLT